MPHGCSVENVQKAPHQLAALYHYFKLLSYITGFALAAVPRERCAVLGGGDAA